MRLVKADTADSTVLGIRHRTHGTAGNRQGHRAAHRSADSHAAARSRGPGG
jgi:hypothetical protein